MKEDQKSSLVWLAFALFIGLETIRYLPMGNWHNPGPGFMPLVAGILLGFLSILNFLRSYLDKTTEEKEPWYSGRRWKTLIFILAVLYVYAFTFEILGFLIGTFLLLVFLFRAVEPQRWIWAIGGSAVISFTTYVVFEWGLRSQLPRGIWGF